MNLRVGELISSNNTYLTYPVRVVIHVLEGTTYNHKDGSIGLRCTVSTGGAYVTAIGAKFSEVSKPQAEKYQLTTPTQIQALLSRYDAIMTAEKLEKIVEELKAATVELKDLAAQKRAASFKKLSAYSVNLHKEKVQQATHKQFDAVERLTDMVVSREISQEEAERIVKRTTK